MLQVYDEKDVEAFKSEPAYQAPAPPTHEAPAAAAGPAPEEVQHPHKDEVRQVESKGCHSQVVWMEEDCL